MGCFANCFGNCKPSRRRRRRPSNKTRNASLVDHLQKYQSVDDFKLSQLTEDDHVEDTENPVQDLSDSIYQKEEKANLSERKKVTFDLNVKFYEDLSIEELPEENIEEERVEEPKPEKKQEKAKTGCDSENSSSSSLFSCPPNHRYQNCRDSDDEFDEIMSSDESENDYYTDGDSEDDKDNNEDDEVESAAKNDKPPMVAQEQSSESLFSISINSRKANLGQEGGDKEVNSPMPNKNAPHSDSYRRSDERNYVDSVLNPVENLTQWKVIKATSKLASKGQAKENQNVVQDFSFPVRKDKEIAVDTSLSTWLVGSEGTPKRSNSRSSSVSVRNSQSDRRTVSPNKFEDRPILGALTLEEIRQMSAASTPRKSPSRSPDDMPIIGSVGSYWSHTGQTTQSGSSTTSTKSRYRESAEVIWDSTSFEERLEKALEEEANAEVLAL